MPTRLRLVDVNIEGKKHLARVLPFLLSEAPDVVCIQEIDEDSIPEFERVLKMECHFAPMLLLGGVARGVAILTNLPVVQTDTTYYAGSDTLTEFDITNTDTKHATERYAFVTAHIQKDDTVFTIGTTHFVWTPDGNASDAQRADLQGLLAAAHAQGEIVFCGDFNAPRGGEIFSELESHFTDNVPAHYTTSLDGTLHRAGQLPYMVDSIFSTPGYAVHNVRMQNGVSDHCALVGEVEKVS